MCVGVSFLLVPVFCVCVSVCVWVAMSGRRMSRPLAQLMLERTTNVRKNGWAGMVIMDDSQHASTWIERSTGIERSTWIER